MMLKLALVALLVVLCGGVSAAPAVSFGCKDDNGNAVDWWLALKLPSGFHYLLATPTSETLTKSVHAMDDPTVGALSHTLNQLWGSGAQYIAFNDSPAVEGEEGESDATAMMNEMMKEEMDVEMEMMNVTATGKTAHAKGVLGWTSGGTGFWLTHSVPNFPLMPSQVSSYQGLSSNAFTYGQHLYCLTQSEQQINDVASMIVLDAPDVFSSFASSTTMTKYKAISDLVNDKFPSSSVCESVVVGNVRVFGKTQYWGKDLWASCVSPHYKTDLYVESWLRGYEIGSSCPPSFPFSTLDVETLSFGALSWKETVDHAKWAVGVQTQVVCFGDINRMTSQYSRGGGCTCVENYALWSQFKNAVTSHTAC